MVLASFAADALALGGHWVYNASVIEKKYGRVEQYEKPLGKSYHPTKSKGDLTHYGDQMFLLLSVLAETPGFELSRFSSAWQQFMDTYKGYIDKATTASLDNFKNGLSPEKSGSSSTDLGGAARIAPLAYYYQTDKANLMAAARAQTIMTHNHPNVIEAAVFFSEVAWLTLNGTRPSVAIKKVTEEQYRDSDIGEWVSSAVASVQSDTKAVIADFGQTCASSAAFPGVVHLILKYEHDLKTALVENVMAGGDSAARGMLAGMILGAHLGMDTIPKKWIDQLAAHNKIRTLLDGIDQVA